MAIVELSYMSVYFMLFGTLKVYLRSISCRFIISKWKEFKNRLLHKFLNQCFTLETCFVPEVRSLFHVCTQNAVESLLLIVRHLKIAPGKERRRLSETLRPYFWHGELNKIEPFFDASLTINMDFKSKPIDCRGTDQLQPQLQSTLMSRLLTKRLQRKWKIGRASCRERVSVPV